MSKLNGKLTVTVIGGKDLESSDIGKMDPFVELTLAKEKFKTKVHKKGGKNPKWGQAFLFNVHNLEHKEVLHVVVQDEDMLSNDKIGRVDIQLGHLFKEIYDKKEGDFFQIVDVDNFKLIRGYVKLSMEWEGTGHDDLVPKPAAAPAAAAPVAAPAAAPVAVQPQYVQQAAPYVVQAPVGYAPVAFDPMAAQQQALAQQQAAYQQQMAQMQQAQMAAQMQAQQQQLAQMQAALVAQQQAAALAQQQAIASQQQAAAAVVAAQYSAAPSKAGPLQHGHKYRFRACTGTNLQLNEKHVVTGRGGDGPYATFTVHVVGPNKVTLTNDDGQTIGIAKNHQPGAHSGDDAVFTVSGDEKEIHFATHHGGHLGILPNGDAKASDQTGTGAHGTFAVVYVGAGSGGSGSHSHVKADPLRDGAKVFLHCKSTGKTLRIMDDGTVNGEGGDGKWAQFVVERKDGDVLFKHPATGKYLRVNDKNLPDGQGAGGPWCNFNIIPHADGTTYSFRAEKAGGNLGILPNGQPKSSSETGTGEHGSFTISHW